MRNEPRSAALLRYLLLASLLTMFVASALQAQVEPRHPPERPDAKPPDPSQSRPKPASVDLGDGSARPGEVALVLVHLTSGDGPKLRRMELNVMFHSANLKFDKVTKSSGDEWKDVEVSLEDYTTEGEGSAESGKVMVVASLLPGASASSGLPEGVLAKLGFRVGEDADGDIVDLQLSAEATAAGENSPCRNPELQMAGVLAQDFV